MAKSTTVKITQKGVNMDGEALAIGDEVEYEGEMPGCLVNKCSVTSGDEPKDDEEDEDRKMVTNPKKDKKSSKGK